MIRGTFGRPTRSDKGRRIVALSVSVAMVFPFALRAARLSDAVSVFAQSSFGRLGQARQAGSLNFARDRQAGRATTSLTYSKDIAPILFTKCSVCHHPGGAAPFSVLTYDALKQFTTPIAALTKARQMPPWKAEPGDAEFVGFTQLTDAEIDQIQTWVRSGAPEGDPKLLPPAPHYTPGWQLGQPDLVVTLPQPYVLPAEGTDAFRVFVFPLNVDALKYVRGIEFQPGTTVVHHATIRLDRTPTSRTLDDEGPGPGYDGLIAHSAGYPDGHFLSWTPGQVPPLLPRGLAWRLDTGADLVVQLHMQPSGKPELVRPQIGFFFGTDPPELTPAMVRLSRQNIDIPPGESHYVVTDSYVLPVNVEVQAIQPHAHFRAREVKATATLPDGSTRSLVYIKDWDFRWQHVYRLVTPLPLPKGTKVAMSITYDNSRNNARNIIPLQRVQWGQKSADEMGDMWIQVLTATNDERMTLTRDFRPQMVAEDIVGYERLIAADPNRVAYRDDVALLYLEEGKYALMAKHFAVSAALRPDAAETHYNLAFGLTYLSAQGGDRALDTLDQALAEYRRALALRPDYAIAHNNLGNLLIAEGPRRNVAEGVTHLKEALRLEPANSSAHYNLGRAYRAQRNTAGAIAEFRDSLRLNPSNSTPATIELAWLLATASDDTLRNGQEAVTLARHAVTATQGKDPAALDALAAAYAETGQFDLALDTAEQAAALIPSRSPASDEIGQRQALYRQRKTFRSN